MLDLDHTLVNSAKFEEVGAELAARLGARLATDAARLPEPERQLHRLPRIGMWTKLRPGARAFLAAAAARFELWIHTNGTRCGPAGCRAVVWTGSRHSLLWGARTRSWLLPRRALSCGVTPGHAMRRHQG